MTTKRRMPVLSPEEIRQISKNAVATVAANKIITNKTAIVNANIAGIVKSATSAEIVKAVNRANYSLATRLANENIKNIQELKSAIKSGGTANAIRAAKASSEITRKIQTLDQTRLLAKSVLEQSSGRNLIQDSFNQVRKNKKG